jgi:feruloyl esterase
VVVTAVRIPFFPVTIFTTLSLTKPLFNTTSTAWVTDSASQSGYLPSSNATNHSLLYSLIDWVENANSTGPSTMIGTKYVNNVVSEGVAFTRPYCRWPNIPVWDGVESVDDAGSWACPSAGVY